MKTYGTLGAFAAVVLLLPAVAGATLITFPDFSDPSLLTINGSAAVVTTGDGDVLRLTPASTNQSGSVFSSATINAGDFSTFFSFRITSPGGVTDAWNSTPGADGLAFLVQSVASDLGGAGADIGYGGISPSIAVEFDTWRNGSPNRNDPSNNHLGITVGGNADHGANAPYTFSPASQLDDGNVWYAWVDYDGTTLEVRANQTGLRPLLADLTRDLDIPSMLGVTEAYVGFTGGTGSAYENHDILSWEYRGYYAPIGVPVPEPTTLVLLGVGICGAAIQRRCFIRAPK